MEKTKKKESLWPESPFQKQVFRTGILIANNNSANSSLPPSCNSKDILHSCPISPYRDDLDHNNARKHQHKFAKHPSRTPARMVQDEYSFSDEEENIKKGKQKNEVFGEVLKDPWGGNSPLKRIEVMEASYKSLLDTGKQSNSFDSLEELEKQILEEAEAKVVQADDTDALQKDRPEALDQNDFEPSFQSTEDFNENNFVEKHGYAYKTNYSKDDELLNKEGVIAITDAETINSTGTDIHVKENDSGTKNNDEFPPEEIDDKSINDKVTEGCLGNKKEEGNINSEITKESVIDENFMAKDEDILENIKHMSDDNSVPDENLKTFVHICDEADSAIEVSMGQPEQDNHRECDKPEKVQTSESNQWVLLLQPGGDPQFLGQVKNGLTGEVFTIYNDVPNDTEKDSKDEDLDWCSSYLAIRVIGLVVLVMGLAALISLSV